MRFIKLAIISAVVISVLLTALSLLLPSHVRISRAVNIAAAPEKISPYINDLHQWQRWNHFFLDTSMKAEVVGRWFMKTNRVDVQMATPGDNFTTTMWMQPNGKMFQGNFVLLPGDSITVVQWYFDFRLRWYPWEKISSIIYDGQMGPVMEKSLTELKELVETSP